ncbi:uncharacterized protein LOC117315851 [Pecten maximus]|uniref:uncharacterized protein LOC117315851 n=1 Tax=Pecten maximus TaxID=6579 RepID=UPI001457FD72|nr:uncharacterized protein LOC117315851 [Pecten maximus]
MELIIWRIKLTFSSVPPNITTLRYLDDTDTYRPVGASDIRLKEGFSLVLGVDVDSNPNSSVILSRYHKTVAKGAGNDTAGSYVFELKNIQCNQTGRYDVRATNFVTQNRSNINPDVKQFGILVSCVPDIPVDFRSSEVGTDYAKVMWVPEFNGGTPQLFHIEVKVVGDEWITYMLNISDKGQGVLMTHKLEDLTPSTDYIIRLNVSNKVGRGNSTEINIRTIEPPTPVNLTRLILVVSVALLLFVTGILVGVVVRLKRNQQGDTTRTEVITTNADAREINVSRPIRGGAAKCEAVATDDDGYTLTLEIPKGGAANYESLTTDDKDYTALSEVSKGGAADYESLTTDDKDYTALSEISKGGAADYESLTTDEKGYIPMSEIPKGGAANYESLTTDDKDYTALSEVSKGGAADYESLTTDDKDYTALSEISKGGAADYESLTTDEKGYIPMSEIPKVEAIYKENGAQVRLILPKPPDRSISTIYFNERTLFTYSYGKAVGNNYNNGVTVELTSTNAKLTIDSLEVKHAGYYYTKKISGNKILGGKFLVITDSPTKPNITPSSQSPIINSSVTLGCSSSSRSKPNNHGLVLTSTWKLNGTEVNNDRFSVQGTILVINSVRLRDKYNQYTCVTKETGQGYSGPPSEESQEFQLTPLCEYNTMYIITIT